MSCNDKNKNKEYEALRSVIEDSKKSWKEVAIYLFKHLKPDSAYGRLKACLNPDKDDRLTFAQIIEMCRYCDRYDALYYMCDECFHERPRLINIEEEETNLMREFIEAKSVLSDIAERLDRVYKQKKEKDVRN